MYLHFIAFPNPVIKHWSHHSRCTPSRPSRTFPDSCPNLTAVYQNRTFPRSSTVSFTWRDLMILPWNIHPVTTKYLTMLLYSSESNTFLSALFVEIIQTTVILKPLIVYLFVCNRVCYMCSASVIFISCHTADSSIILKFVCFRF